MLHGKKLMNIGTLLMEYNSFYQICVYICHEGIVFIIFLFIIICMLFVGIQEL